MTIKHYEAQKQYSAKSVPLPVQKPNLFSKQVGEPVSSGHSHSWPFEKLSWQFAQYLDTLSNNNSPLSTKPEWLPDSSTRRRHRRIPTAEVISRKNISSLTLENPSSNKKKLIIIKSCSARGARRSLTHESSASCARDRVSWARIRRRRLLRHSAFYAKPRAFGGLVPCRSLRAIDRFLVATWPARSGVFLRRACVCARYLVCFGFGFKSIAIVSMKTIFAR